MEKRIIQNCLRYFITLVWIVSGLFCKVLNFVPRHQEIVSRILGSGNNRILTIVIGIAEIVMAVWILSGIYTRLNAIIQIIVIAVMNILEFFLAPDLLLWGKANSIFALLFIFLIYYTEFRINKKRSQKTACFHS